MPAQPLHDLQFTFDDGEENMIDTTIWDVVVNTADSLPYLIARKQEDTWMELAAPHYVVDKATGDSIPVETLTELQRAILPANHSNYDAAWLGARGWRQYRSRVLPANAPWMEPDYSEFYTGDAVRPDAPTPTQPTTQRAPAIKQAHVDLVIAIGASIPPETQAGKYMADVLALVKANVK